MTCLTHHRYHLARLTKRARLSTLHFKPTHFITYLVTFLFYFSLLTFSATPHASSCSNQFFDNLSVVTHIYDGDTVKLANGDKVRLIGINTPEMNYDTGKPQPFAQEAKRHLEKLILGKKIGVKYGLEKTDRYQRKLAHIFLPNGTNVQYGLLKEGLAFTTFFPPNLWGHNCYLHAESIAKRNKLRVWNNPYFKPVAANEINKNQLGFKHVTGTVSHVINSNKSIQIILSNKVSLRISKKDIHYFKNFKPGLTGKQLTGLTITASGWISLHKNRFSIRIKHPGALRVKSTKNLL